MRKQLVYLCAGLFLLACGNDQPPVNVAPDAADFEHPETPEAVVEQYQFYLDNNNFEMAKQLSTPAEQEMLDYLAEMVAGQPVDSTVMQTEFQRIVCQEKEGLANCIAVIEEEGEQLEMLFDLVKIDGKWFVDTRDEEGELQYDTSVEDGFSTSDNQ